jgi:hypothetical protein
LNRLISPLLARGTVVISSSCSSMIRKAVSPGWTVTVWPAWLKPTYREGWPGLDGVCGQAAVRAVF